MKISTPILLLATMALSACTIGTPYYNSGYVGTPHYNPGYAAAPYYNSGYFPQERSWCYFRCDVVAPGYFPTPVYGAPYGASGAVGPGALYGSYYYWR
jgi:hypothetical protein